MYQGYSPSSNYESNIAELDEQYLDDLGELSADNKEYITVTRRIDAKLKTIDQWIDSWIHDGQVNAEASKMAGLKKVGWAITFASIGVFLATQAPSTKGLSLDMALLAIAGVGAGLVFAISAKRDFVKCA